MKSLIASTSIVLIALLLSVSVGQDKASDTDVAKEHGEIQLQTDQKTVAPQVNDDATDPSVTDVFASEEPAPNSKNSDQEPISIRFRAVMYVIEADWSKANNRDQASLDLKTAFRELNLSAAEETELFTRAPEILFGPKGVSFYSANHAKSLIEWLAQQGLIKSVFVSSPATIKTNEGADYGVFSDNSMRSRPFMKPGDMGLVIRDENDSVPIVPPAALNMGELSHRAFRQVWWFQMNHREGRPLIDSKLFFEKKFYDSEDDENRFMVMEEGTPIDTIDLPRNEVAFFNAFTVPQYEKSPSHLRTGAQETLRIERAKQKGVFAVIAISRGQEVSDEKPELRLPDRVDLIQNIWQRYSAKVQLSPIDVPDLSPFLREMKSSKPDAPVPSAVSQSEPVEASVTTNLDSSNGNLASLRKRYLEAEARTIALTQKQMTEPVDADVFEKALSDAFELRQEVHRLELGQLRGRMEALEQKIRTRDAHKNEILERRAKELMKLAKEWHSSMKMSDIDSGFDEPHGEVNEKKFNGQRQQGQLTDTLQRQPNKPSPDLMEKAGTVIDMSDKKQWAKPSKAPAPISAEEQIELKEKQSVENLQKLMRALLGYEKDHGRLPPAVVERTVEGKGTVRHSWRVEILPYLGQKELYDAYKMDEPWDSPSNMNVLEQMPDVFASPLDSPDSTNTSYFAIVTPELKPQMTKASPESAEDSFRPPLIDQNVILHYANGTVFSDPKGTRLKAITDGPHRTIALFEFKQNVPWTQPLDINIEMNSIFGVEGLWYNDGWHVAYVDGNVRQLSIENSLDEIKSLLRINDNDQIEPKVIMRRVKRRQAPNPHPSQSSQAEDPFAP